MYYCKYFKLKELVSERVYNKFGGFAWSFFDEAILRDLDKIREYHDLPIVINNWASGGNLSQCGLRCNLDDLVKNKKNVYCSAHIMGKAFDLHSKNNVKLYSDVKKLIENQKLSVIKRLESPSKTDYKWVHVDSFRTEDNKLKIF